jgi:MATE family multidrug resistance protein
MNSPHPNKPGGGIRELIHLAFPLVLASSGHAFRLFADRLMLARYSPEAIAATIPAGMLCFALMAFFIGTAGYVNTFVAQFAGAKQQKSTGLAVWQGIFLSILGGAVITALAPAAESIFNFIGHPPGVRDAEIVYFRTLCWFSFPGIAISALNAFWSGRGRTRVVMVIELFCAAINIGLNVLLIHGKCGFPELGIQGAAIATGVANLAGMVLALTLFLSPGNRANYNTWPARKLNWPLLKRVIRFGLPSGLQFGFDMLAFQLFVAIVGTYGVAQLEASNIAFGMNAMAFIPMIGLSISVSVLVGQSVGASDIPSAKRAVRSGLVLALLYNLCIAFAFVAIPDQIVSMFTRAGDESQIETLAMASQCLRFVAAYLMFDALYLVFSHGIKGAGDTRFALWAGIALSWGTLVIPTSIAYRLGYGFWTLWGILVLHVFLAAITFALRYRGGKWQSMSVLETAPEAATAAAAECDLHAERGI